MPKQTDKDEDTVFDRAARRAAAIRVGKEGGLSNLGHGATMLGALIREVLSPTTPPSRTEIQAAHAKALMAGEKKEANRTTRNAAQKAKGFKANAAEAAEAMTTGPTVVPKITKKVKKNLSETLENTKRETGY